MVMGYHFLMMVSPLEEALMAEWPIHQRHIFGTNLESSW
jgi:hypothetical protein